MTLPFTAEQFFWTFARYNEAVWPAPVVAYVAAGTAILSVLLGWRRSGAVTAGVLGAFWVFQGVAYQIGFFSAINPAAYAFGALMIGEGLALLWSGLARGQLVFRPRPDFRGAVGTVLMAYGMFVYPVIGILAGHSYPRAPVFGVAPCPTVIFTFGMLLWTSRPVPRLLLVGPTLWAAIGSVAAVQLGVYQDYGLAAAALLSAPLLWPSQRTLRRERSETVQLGR
jgi:hypothetical protein